MSGTYNGFVRDEAKYYNRTVHAWHAHSFPSDYSAIDLDLAGFCPRCHAWLYFIEASEQRGKPTALVQRLGMQCGAPALLIIHADGRITEWRVVHPELSPWLGQERLTDYIRLVRRAHTWVCHPLWVAS